ncbi:immunoglobulin superfamily member 1-like [Trachemys scripta elegans]|uniref:immunoglobulin superfamily member 1-like n=1 Tax=Trachemys scripta elegans TaxID=31138 RepID=UPI0015558721|nr:immunoglobulin superfamily member 1-like [Trachemys scripta elegans]
MAVGGALTIQCKCRCQGMRVVLYKGGDPSPLRYMDNAGDVAEFPISNVTQQDSGRYTCRSGSTSEPFVWSDPSEPIELVMRELYPKPTISVSPRGDDGPGGSCDRPLKADLYQTSISVSPRGVMAMGGTVTIRCECRYQGLRVVLYKEGDHTTLQHIENIGDVTKFPICSVTQDGSRSYTCRYGSTSQAFIWSDPSEPVELVVRGGDSGLTLEELSSESSPDNSKNSTDLCCPFTVLMRRLDFTWGNILRLGLGAGVLLALVLIMAEASYCRKETPDSQLLLLPAGDMT